MLDLDCVEQLGDAASGDQFGNGIFRDCSRAFLASASHQDFLNGVAYNLTSYATGPANSWPIEATTFPPIGIATSGVHRCLETTGQRLTQLVSSHQQTLTMCRACLMEFELANVR